MSDMLLRSVPSRSLRSSGLLTLPKPRTKRHGEAAFSYYAPSLWTSLPEDLGGDETVDIFKRDLKIPFHLCFSSGCFLVVHFLLVLFCFYPVWGVVNISDLIFIVFICVFPCEAHCVAFHV
jgi:hypothetical protein